MVVVEAITIFLHHKDSLNIQNSLILYRDNGVNDNNNFQNEYQLDMLSSSPQQMAFFLCCLSIF